MDPFERNLYEILGVKRTCLFEELKRGYYARAKECHPDLYPDEHEKEEEFKRLVSAFDILSDARSRKIYDEKLAYGGAPDLTARVFRPVTSSIMDSVADDILEEMIVGNNAPRGTTLQTLMLDLTRTSRFIRFREAKFRFQQGRHRTAYKLCHKLIEWSPGNILYHFYLAESARFLGKKRIARRHLRICVQLGLYRQPMQRLEAVRRRLAELREEQGLLGHFLNWLAPPPPLGLPEGREQMTYELSRAFGRMLGSRGGRPRRPRTPIRQNEKFLPR